MEHIIVSSISTHLDTNTILNQLQHMALGNVYPVTANCCQYFMIQPVGRLKQI